MDFKAAVLSKVEAPLEIHDVEMTGLKPNDVLVRNHASGLCHTDFEVIHGSLRFPPAADRAGTRSLGSRRGRR